MELNRNTVTSKSILCDIEGTTSSIDFVKETLFPFALKNVEKFLRDNWERDDVKESVIELRKLAEKDAEEKVDGAVPVLGEDDDKSKIIESVVKSVEWLMGSDRKVTPLKTLQGLIWEDGYKDGSIKGHIYDDVPKAFENWTKTGHKIYIYSSGSVMAQKLLFGNTSAGDLQTHLSGYFDTKIGAKVEKESYEAIAKEIECTTNEIVFLTDVVKEAKAAKEAGMNVVIVVRPGNAPLTDEDKKDFPTIETFDVIPFEEVATAKRKIEEETEDKQETAKPAKLAKLETADDAATEKSAKVAETQPDKTDDESKCDTAVEKKETDRTDAAQETDAKGGVEDDEKMETEQVAEEVTAAAAVEATKVEPVVDVKAVELKEEKKKDVAVEETKKEEETVLVEDVVEKMEVDAVESIAEVKDTEAEADKEVTEAEPKVIEVEKVTAAEAKGEPSPKEVATVVDSTTAVEPAKDDEVATEITAEKKKDPKAECSKDDVEKKEEVVNGKGEEKVIDEVAEEAKKEVEGKATEEPEKKEDEKAAGSTNGDVPPDAVAAGATTDGVNGDKGGDDGGAKEEKAENGKDAEVKNGHNEKNANEVAKVQPEAADGGKDATPDASTGSEQVSEVIVKKCVEPMVKSPVPQPVEAES